MSRTFPVIARSLRGKDLRIESDGLRAVIDYQAPGPDIEPIRSTLRADQTFMRNLALAFSLSVVATGAAALGPLKDVARISEGLIATGIAVEISDVCEDLSPRLLRGIAFLNSLKSHASDLGYSDAEIDAYVNDKAEEARLEAIARARLAGKGAVAGQPETYCAVGRAEIAAGSQIGRLLR